MKDSAALALNFLQNLIRFDTVNPPGQERAAACYIRDTLHKYGISARLQEVASGRNNVIAQLGNSGNQLLLVGHLDVVPPGKGWHTDPFSPTIQNGKLYGRGSCDMKAGIAAMMAAAVSLYQDGWGDAGRLTLAFVADEEVDGLGTQVFLRQFHPDGPTGVVIGEPTENQIHIAHRGVIRLRITVHGKGCHSSQPQDGINAILAMTRIVQALEPLHLQRQAIPHPILPSPTMCCTMIQGGEKDNMIPGLCSCVLDCRTIPGDTSQALQQQVEEYIAAIADLPAGISIQVEPFIEVKPGMTQPDSPLVTLAKQACQDVLGQLPLVRDFPACCDMSFYTAADLDTIICGPGSISQAHTVDEFVSIRQLQDSVRLYEALAKLFKSAPVF